MHEIMTFVDFVVDLACLMPPIGEVDAITFTRNQAIIMSYFAVGLLVLSVIIDALKCSFSGNVGKSVVIAVCVCVIAFLWPNKDILKSIILAGYPPLVIALRFAEGVIVGSSSSKHLRLWHSLILIGVVAGLYYLFKTMPNDVLMYIKGGWALLGAVLASFMWTRIMSKTSIFESPFSRVSIFLVFASTLIYVSASSLEQAFYQWALPIGLPIGMIFNRLNHPATEDN